MNRWYEGIPYGPLTREDFDRLSSSFYDASRMDEEAAAIRRGIRSGDFLGMAFHDMKNKGTNVSDEVLTVEDVPSEARAIPPSLGAVITKPLITRGPDIEYWDQTDH